MLMNSIKCECMYSDTTLKKLQFVLKSPLFYRTIFFANIKYVYISWNVHKSAMQVGNSLNKCTDHLNGIHWTLNL